LIFIEQYLKTFYARYLQCADNERKSYCGNTTI
jgi:hypothetical protein